MKRLLLALLLLVAACVPALAGTLVEGPLRAVVPDEVAEGQPFLVEVTLDNQIEHVFVEWMGKTVEIPMARRAGLFRGEALLGAGLGTEAGEQTLVVEALRPNRRELVLGKVRVTPGTFPEQHLKLPPQMVTPSKENLARIKREQELVARTVGVISPRRFWSLPFIRPVPGEITSAFGLRRILNGQPRSPHSGVDLNGASGETVLAAAQGRVALTGDFYYNGKSVFLDHGNGVFTMYFHLSSIDVAEGQHVERGQQIAKVGATGRATGPHLHLGLKVLGQNLDPMPLFTPGGVFDRTSKGGS